MMERLTRREVVAAAAASAISAGSLSQLAKAETQPTQLDAQDSDTAKGKPADRKFQIGMVTYNIAADWDLPTVIKRCKQAGFVAVELRTTHRHGVEPTMTKEERAEVKKQFAGSGVELFSLGSICEFHSPDPTIVAKNIDDARKFIDLAVDVGAKAVKIRPNGMVKGLSEEKSLEQIGRAMHTVGDAAQAAGIRICCEMHGKTTCEPTDMRRLMELTDHPSVGVTWNSNMVDVKDGSVRESFEMMQRWIWNVHMADLTSAYPWREFFKLLRESGYAGYTMMEAKGPISKEPADIMQFMAYYKALWDELSRPA